MQIDVSMGYTSIEVIPLKPDELLREIKKLSVEDLKSFHEKYMDFVEQKRETEAMLKLSEDGFSEWDNKEDDVYNDL